MCYFDRILPTWCENVRIWNWVTVTYRNNPTNLHFSTAGPWPVTVQGGAGPADWRAAGWRRNSETRRNPSNLSASAECHLLRQRRSVRGQNSLSPGDSFWTWSWTGRSAKHPSNRWSESCWSNSSLWEICSLSRNQFPDQKPIFVAQQIALSKHKTINSKMAESENRS